jgi:hypothetical protein
MEEQEFYRFKIKTHLSFFTPLKYKVYDALTNKLKFTCRFKGMMKLSCILYDQEGKEILGAQKLGRTTLSYDWIISKSKEEIAKFDRYREKFLVKEYEVRTKSGIYRSNMGKFIDEQGGEVFSIEGPEKMPIIKPREIFVAVNQDFDVNLAIMVCLIVFIHSFMT